MHSRKREEHLVNFSKRCIEILCNKAVVIISDSIEERLFLFSCSTVLDKHEQVLKFIEAYHVPRLVEEGRKESSTRGLDAVLRKLRRSYSISSKGIQEVICLNINDIYNLHILPKTKGGIESIIGHCFGHPMMQVVGE